jgi:hypothetical protein
MAPRKSRYGLVSVLIGSACAVALSCGSSDATKKVGGGAGEGGGGHGGGTSQPSAGSGGTASPTGGHGGTTPIAAAGAAGAGATQSEAGASGAAAGGEAGAAGASCGAMPASRISIAFDAANAERVTSLTWLDNSNVATANLAASGGGPTCGDPTEFFAESYGAPEGTSPIPVVAGSRSTSQTCGPDITITASAVDCTNAAQTPVTTEYHFYGGAKSSQLRVTRTLGFGTDTVVYNGTTGVRVWVPRVPLGTFPNVIYPNAGETAVTSTAAAGCGNDCLIAVGASWSGHWFADVAANGLAMIVRRDASLTAPVQLTINNDSSSGSNLASFVVLQPQSGWKAPVTEVEYLCFADLTSWPQTDRDAAKLPAFCGP